MPFLSKDWDFQFQVYFDQKTMYGVLSPLVPSTMPPERPQIHCARKCSNPLDTSLLFSSMKSVVISAHCNASARTYYTGFYYFLQFFTYSFQEILKVYARDLGPLVQQEKCNRSLVYIVEGTVSRRDIAINTCLLVIFIKALYTILPVYLFLTIRCALIM